MPRVTVPCPICDNDLDADVTLLDDSEGESPYIRNFTALDDYRIISTNHVACMDALTDCQEFVEPVELRVTTPTQKRKEKFLDTLCEAAIDAQIEADADHYSDERY